MAEFDDQSARRISTTVRREERRVRNQRGRRQRFANKRAPLVKFELLQDLDQWSGDVVQAARKTWDPSADDGNGGYVVDCNDIVFVADYNQVGHTAAAGGFGAAEMHARDNGPKWVGTIIDLCCPGDEKGVCSA